MSILFNLISLVVGNTKLSNGITQVSFYNADWFTDIDLDQSM